MRKIIIHIGYPKTGTSFLQEKVLTELHGAEQVNYLHFRKIEELLQEITCTNSLFFDANVVKKRFDPLLKDGVNVISYESLIAAVYYKSVNLKSTAENLFALFPEATILITLRNQADIALSLHAQYVHEGGTLGLTEFLGMNRVGLKEIDDNVLDLRSFEYDKVIKFYKELFGSTRISILFFEEFVANRDEFMFDLYQLMGIEGEQKMIEPSGKTNEGYAKNQIRLARFMNRMFYSHFNRNSLALNFKLPFSEKRINIAVLRKLLQSSLSFSILGRRKKDYSAFRKNLKERFLASNERLASENNLKLPEKYFK